MVEDHAKAIAKLFIAFSRIETLYEALAHGSEEHKAWLKKTIDDHLAGKRVERVHG